MKPFFSTPERIILLQRAARNWIGTPFVPHAALCGAGVDCVNLCAQIYYATGFLGKIEFPPYTMDGGKHNVVSQLTTWLAASGKFAALDRATPPAAGDLLCFTTGRSAHHTGLVLEGPHFIHCLFARKVMSGTLSDRTFARRLVAVYRPQEGVV